MDEASRISITRHMEDLIRDMDVGAVVTNLQANLLLSDEQVSKIQANSTREDSCRHFITVLKTKGPTAFDLFVQALQKTDQKHLADILLEGKKLSHPSGAAPVFAAAASSPLSEDSVLASLTDAGAKERYRTNLTHLCNSIESHKEIVAALIEKKIMTKPQSQKILAHSTDYDKNYALIDYMGKRGQKDFVTFVGILRDTAHDESVIQPLIFGASSST